MGNMKFRGLSTKDLDLIIQFKPDYNFPTKDVTIEHIPGRNGDLYIDNKSWQNVQRTYSIASVFRPGTDFVSNSEKLIKWLTQESGYFRLEDDYDPHVYRIAAFKGSGSLPNLYDQATVINLTFDCKPQRYYKSGEKEISFANSKALLVNPTGYDALPDIKISGITNPSQDDVLLLTVGTTSDEETLDKVSSIITLSNIPQDVSSITLVSEEQRCYSNQNGNINGSINLNDTQFPTLEKGTSLVLIKKYKEHDSVIEAYNNKINDSQLVCQCKYLPFDAQVKTKEKLTVIKSWNLLKQQVEEVYDAKSYATYCMEKADIYTFESYNNLLTSKGVRYTVRPSSDEVDSNGYIKEAPWLKLIDNGNGTYTVKVGDITNLVPITSPNLFPYGGYFYLNKGNITLYFQDEVLESSLKESASLQIDFYPASNDNYKIAVTYDTPAWCKMVVNYNTDSSSSLYIESISFVTNQNGYFYLPKSGLFGKAGWSKLNSNVELTTLKWSSFSKAFMPSGISVSKTATFTYYFLPYPYKTPADPNNPTAEEKWLQYEPVMQYKLDKDGNPEVDGNGNKILEIANDVNFYVDSVSDDITTLTIKAKVSAWFRNNDLELSEFITRPDGASPLAINDIITMPAGFKATSSFTIYTIRENKFPSYSIIENWPEEYLDPEPKKEGNYQVRININPTNINGGVDFKVNKKGWFRVKYTVTTGSVTEDKNSPWLLLDQNNLVFSSNPIAKYPSDGVWPDQQFTMAGDQNITIEYLEALETSNDFPITQYIYNGIDRDGNSVSVPDIAFFDKEGNEYNQVPTWLEIIVDPGVDPNHLDATLIFNVGNGSTNTSLYKWDTKSIWMSKDKIEQGHIVDSARIDDTTIYYLASLPQYSLAELSNKYRVVINQNSATGDPETITLYPLNNGYYKAKNSTNWKWFDTNTEICISKNSESTTIYDLTEAVSQDNFDIVVTPRWWSL